MPRFRRSAPPEKTGHYRRFRALVRSDFEQSCAHCVLADLLAAGEEAFEIDHYRPRHKFPELEHAYLNLYYACHPCNRIKGDHWPGVALEQRGIGLVDLCAAEFEEHYLIGDDGRVLPRTESASYTVDLLRLNRRHLVEIRDLLGRLAVMDERGRLDIARFERLPSRST